MAIKFDNAQAKIFEGDLENGMKEVKKTLRDMHNEVEMCKKWWEGKSREKFVKAHEKANSSVIKEMDNITKYYKNLMREIWKSKLEEENA